MSDVCYLCGEAENGWGYHTRCVNECDRCELLVCSDCAEYDYDMVGDPGHYVCCQWVCAGGCKSTALVPYDPHFHTFDWSTVADAAEQAFINECRVLGKAIRDTTAAFQELERFLAA